MRPGGLFIIAAGLCGIALIRKASSDIADAFADSDGRTASLANLVVGVVRDSRSARVIQAGGGQNERRPGYAETRPSHDHNGSFTI